MFASMKNKPERWLMVATLAAHGEVNRDTIVTADRAEPNDRLRVRETRTASVFIESVQQYKVADGHCGRSERLV